MIRYTVKVPMKQVTEARRTCRLLGMGVGMLEKELAKLDPADLEREGCECQWAMQDRQRIRDDIEETKTHAANMVRKLAQEYKAEVDRQAAMRGEDLKTADYALIRDKLITDPGQLELMAERNQDNYTLLVSIDHYATENHWTGFTVVSNAPLVEAFGHSWFKLCEKAALNPDGAEMSQIQTEGELGRLLNEYGVLEVAELPEDEA